MPLPSQEPTLHFLQPPGPSVHNFRVLPTGQITTTPTRPDLPPPPQLFRDALAIRAEVFVREQRCSGAEEIDADDAESWHWVIYADADADEVGEGEKEGVGKGVEGDGAEREGGGRGGEGVAVTGQHKEAGKAGKIPAATIRLVPAQRHRHTEGEDGPKYSESKIWNGREAFVKIGRLATVSTYRGRGYGRILVEAAAGFAKEKGRGGGLDEDEEVGEWKGLMLAHAQRDVEGWYKSVGWVVDEGMGLWLEEGIEHVGMWRRVELEGVQSEGKR